MNVKEILKPRAVLLLSVILDVALFFPVGLLGIKHGGRSIGQVEKIGCFGRMVEQSVQLKIDIEISQLMKAGNLDKALSAYVQTLLKPNVSADNLVALANHAVTRGRLADALRVIKDACERDPKHPEALVEATFIAFRSGQESSALEYARRAEKICRNAEHFDKIGNVYSRLNKVEKALEVFERALKLSPTDGHYNANVAVTLVSLGRFEEAEGYFDKSIEHGDNNFANYLNRSRLRFQTPEDNHVDELEEKLGTSVTDWQAEIFLNFALAKEYEDLEDYSKSFARLKRGADIRKKHMQGEEAINVRVHSVLMESQGEAFLKKVGAGFTSDAPIFIVGMPRSGTTLVDTILGRHTDVLSAGELQLFGRVVNHITTAKYGTEKLRSQGDMIRRSVDVDFEDLGRGYIDVTAPFTNSSKRFTDKFPANYVYCGLIAKSLPNARIVHVRRDPMDACYAIYKQLFVGQYQFSYDLKELAEYYVAYLELMAHWDKFFPEHIHTIKYEDLVTSQETETRRLLAACNLEWQDACLKFEDAEGPVSTASAAQVRQPIYETSIGNWHRYEEQLEPMRKVLADHGVKIS